MIWVVSRSCVYRGQHTPDYRSARNNLYSGIPHVSSGLDLYLLPVQYFPLLPVQCFPLLPVRICDSDPRFWSPFLVPVSGPRFWSPFCFLFQIPFCFLFRFPFRIPFCFPFRFRYWIPFRFPFRFTYRILFHDPRFSTDPRSGSRSGFRYRLAFPVTAPPASSRFAPTRRCFI